MKGMYRLWCEKGNRFCVGIWPLKISSAPVCAKVRAKVWPAACPNLPGPAPSRCDPSPVPRFHQFPRRAAAGSNTLDQFVGDDSGKNDGANNCKLQVSWMQRMLIAL